MQYRQNKSPHMRQTPCPQSPQIIGGFSRRCHSESSNAQKPPTSSSSSIPHQWHSIVSYFSLNSLKYINFIDLFYVSWLVEGLSVRSWVVHGLDTSCFLKCDQVVRIFHTFSSWLGQHFDAFSVLRTKTLCNATIREIVMRNSFHVHS